MPKVKFDVSNEVPPTHRVTLVGVRGEGFRPQSTVSIGMFGPGGRTMAPANAAVKPDGTFEWGTGVFPQVHCGAAMSVRVHDSDGTNAGDSAEVFCP